MDFFNQINLLYGSITEFCTNDTCPCMSAGCGIFCVEREEQGLVGFKGGGGWGEQGRCGDCDGLENGRGVGCRV